MSDSSDDLFSDSDWELGISGLISQTHGNSDSVLPEDNVIEQQVQEHYAVIHTLATSFIDLQSQTKLYLIIGNRLNFRE